MTISNIILEKKTLIIKYLDELWNMVGLQNVPDSSEDIQGDVDILKIKQRT